MTAAGEIIEEGGMRDGDVDLEGEGGGEGEGEGGVEVGGEEVDAGFVGYFYLDWGLPSAVGATTITTTTCVVVIAAAAAAAAAAIAAAAVEVGHVRGLSIAALELGEQAGFVPEVFPHNFIEQRFGQLGRVMDLIKSHQGLPEEEGRGRSRRRRSRSSRGRREGRGGGGTHMLLVVGFLCLAPRQWLLLLGLVHGTISVEC